MDTRRRSVMVDFTMNEARHVVLSELELLMYSNLHFIGIVHNMPNPYKHQVAHTSKPDRQCSLVIENKLLAATPISWSQGTGVQNLIKNVPTLPPSSHPEANPTPPLLL